MDKKVGVIGYGNMGSAIISGALDTGVLKKENVFVYDISAIAMENAESKGVYLCKSNKEVCENSDIIILAIKPQTMKEAILQTEGMLNKKAVISIAAGVTKNQIMNMIDGDARILRVMPNTPAMVSAGAFAMCTDNDLAEDEKALSSDLFEAIGLVEWVPEKLIDAVCGLSGGGPAWVAMFIEALSDGGVKQGLPRAVAYRLATQTVMGTAKLALESGQHPGILKDMVTSPGGTTIEGCEALEKGGFRYAVMDCVRAATEKSIKLGTDF